MSDYIRQHAVAIDYKVGESWSILNEIEQSIKQKIEAVGTPLKDWDIEIKRGILTGLNEAFIISKEKRDELISADPKSAEIIRPILRGKDIKKYEIKFQELYLIALFPSKNYDIDQFPAIKDWLVNGKWVKKKTKNNPPTPIGSGRLRLEQTGKVYECSGIKFKARKKTTNRWFETQDSIKYWDDFSKQKIIYPNMTKYLPFYLDNSEYFVNQKAFVITGEGIEYLTAFCNSSLFKFVYSNNFPELQGGTRELSKVFFERLFIKPVSKETENVYSKIIKEIQKLKGMGKDTKLLEKQLDTMIFEEYNLEDTEISIVKKHSSLYE
ncbi:TaqI-like C-terminal specificity domain-containing protein [Lactobacillus sp. AN1001]